MVAKKDRARDLDEYGFPPMEGVEMSDAEDLALFWGTDWRQKIDQALADVEAGRVTRFGSTEELLAFLRQR